MSKDPFGRVLGILSICVGVLAKLLVILEVVLGWSTTTVLVLDRDETIG
jgi:hypothetical protein